MMNNNAQHLLQKHFDTALESPDGIKKLRELILTLAMQGKLVKQDPKDQSASELLKEIQAEKERLIRDGKIKKQKELPPIKPGEVPYEVPKGWVWTRLGGIGETNIGLTYSPQNIANIGIPVLRSSNVQNGILDFKDLVRVQMDVKESAIVSEGDLLICARNGSKALVGKTAMITGLNEPMAFGAFMAIYRSRLNAFILRFINSPLFRKMIDEVNTMTINQITQQNLRNTAFPLPPLAEQKRIVAKIDELMALCDKLETQRNARNNKRLAVHTAAINRLLTAADTNDFDSAWHFITRHFDPLYSVKENVAELKKAILTLAMQGKLVKQDPRDQPASELLKEIQADASTTLSARKKKELPPIKPEEVPYEVPEGWVWTRLGATGITQTGSTPPSKDVGNFGDFIPFLGPGNIKNGVIDYSGEGLSEQGLQKSRLIDKGSILMVCIGGSIGKHAVTEIPIACNQQINTLMPYKPTPTMFFYWVMGTQLFQAEIFKRAGGSATPIINKQKWETIPIPLPPLAEQKRIVARIDELMALCDKLENQIDQATEKQTALFDAVLAKV